MPEICRFYGIVIFMNYNDHQPPHFRARYQDQEIAMEIQTGIVQGKMSRRALRMLFEVNPDTNAIEWPNGADFAPEFLYEIGKELRKVA